MSYATLHYVGIGRRVYTPGEIIDEVMDEAQTDRLLRLGAIKAMDPAGEVRTEPKPAAEAKAERVKPVKEEPEEESAEETEMEPPEIDIMDGIVGKAKPKSRRKAK